MNITTNNSHTHVLGVWLLFCAAVVYVMVVVGGITRLTQSGLSMVEWAPIMGIFPPIGEVAWIDVFTKYQSSPEYQKVNMGMSLAAFKQIFWWEYGHRVLGRVIGMIYFFPLVFFLIKGMIPKQWKVKLLGLFVLGGMQGLMGWYMVKSGLVDLPHVSQYRLTAHLGLALLIFAYMFWFALDMLRGNKPNADSSSSYQLLTGLTVGVVFMMMLSGGFVAGTKAGFIMNTFPLMNGEWLPQSWMSLTPWWRNLFENPIAIQFIHRCLAIVVLITVLTAFYLSLKQKFASYSYIVLGVVIIQLGLGISALLLVVPIALGAAHQAGAVAVLASSLFVAHCARKTK